MNSLKTEPESEISKARSKPKYYMVKGNAAYWQPGMHLRAKGYQNIRLGKPGPDAMEMAEKFNAEVERDRAAAKADEPQTVGSSIR